MKTRVKQPNVVLMLVLVGGLLVFLSGLLALLGFPIGFTFTEGHLMMTVLSNISFYHDIVETISGTVLLLATVFINTKKLSVIQNWSVVILLFSVISLIGGGGFLVGFILTFIGGIFGVSYGFFVYNRPDYRQTTQESRKSISQVKERRIENTNVILKPEEQKLYDLINDSEGAIFQAELVEKSGFSKVKVTRILDRLEGRGIIERRRRGMTNIVMITKNYS